MAENREDERAVSGEDSLLDGGFTWAQGNRAPEGNASRAAGSRSGSGLPGRGACGFPLRRRRRCISSADRKRETEIKAPR